MGIQIKFMNEKFNKNLHKLGFEEACVIVALKLSASDKTYNITPLFIIVIVFNFQPQHHNSKHIIIARLILTKKATLKAQH